VARALRHRWTPAVLALAAFGISLWVQQAIYPHLSWNRDEPVYLWHVEVLRNGQLTTPDGGRPTLFLPWLSAAREGELFSQYTLGWPLVLLAGALLGSTDLAIAAGTSLTVVGSWALAHELLEDRLLASVTAILMLASPLVLVQSGTHLNYLFTLGLGLLFATALISGVRLARTWRLVVAGALLGWIALTRPFDAVVWGGLTVAYLAIVHRHRLAEHLRRAPWFFLGLLPLLVLILVLNLRLTGRMTEFPITVADPLDKFGFGDRRLMPRFGIVPYGKRMALSSLGRNSWWLPFFLVGAHVGAVLAVAGAWLGRRRWATLFLVALGLAFPISYFPFFGTHISSLTARLSGPIYYIPAYFSLSALMAVALVRLARRSPRWAAATVAVLVVVTVPIAANRLRVNQELSRANLPWAESIESLDEPSIVVVSPTPYLLFLNPYAINGHDLEDEVIYAADAGPRVLDLVADNPDRQAYLQRSSLEVRLLAPTEDPEVPEITLTPLEVRAGRSIEVTASVSAPEDEPVKATWVEIEGGRTSRLRTSPDSTYEASWELVPHREATTDTTFRVPRGMRTVHVVTGWGRTLAEARTSPAVRRSFYVRSSADGLEILTPGTVALFEHPRKGTADERSWIELLDTSYLDVEISPVP
jgi:hypothetical protein